MSNESSLREVLKGLESLIEEFYTWAYSPATQDNVLAEEIQVFSQQMRIPMKAALAALASQPPHASSRPAEYCKICGCVLSKDHHCGEQTLEDALAQVDVMSHRKAFTVSEEEVREVIGSCGGHKWIAERITELLQRKHQAAPQSPTPPSTLIPFNIAQLQAVNEYCADQAPATPSPASSRPARGTLGTTAEDRNGVATAPDDGIDPGAISDGYHTFKELYEHRHALFSVICARFRGWKSKQHADGTMFEDSFIAGVNTPLGAATYHIPLRWWDCFHCGEFEHAPIWDGHTAADVPGRIAALAEDVARPEVVAKRPARGTEGELGKEQDFGDPAKFQTILALRQSLREMLPLAESYLRSAPCHPDNAKLETARSLCR